MIPLRLYAYAAAVLAVLAALWGYGHHQKQQGRAEVQAKFDAYIDKQTAAQSEEDRRTAADSITKFRNVERSRENDANIQHVRSNSDDGLNAELGRLRSAIAARDRAPSKSADPEAIARANEEAKVSRELFGECASRYSEVAQVAGELAGQVTGLQGFIDAALIE
jgi:hypothetical protein